MGKKRSKTQKQKQNKASNKLAKAFQKKLGISKTAKAAAKAVASSKDAMLIQSPQRRLKGTPRSSTAPSKKTAAAVVVDADAATTTIRWQRNRWNNTNKNKANSKKDSSEQDDFARAHASLQERERTAEWQQQHRRRTMPTNNLSSNSPLALAPPIFLASDKDKSTEQLIGEATSRVSQWQGIQAPPPITMLTTTTPTKSFHSPAPSHAMPTPFPTPRASWTGDDDDDDQHFRPPVRSVNPWAVLAEEDENDDQNDARKDAGKPLFPQNPFQFAPASFSLQPNRTPPPSNLFAAATTTSSSLAMAAAGMAPIQTLSTPRQSIAMDDPDL